MSTFGNYEVLKHLASGGMAKIFLARAGGAVPAEAERLFVIKQLKPELAKRDDFLSMFIDEANLSRRLRHPNIVRVYDTGHVESSYYFSMDFLLGQDLIAIFRRLREQGRARLALEQAISIAIQVCAALEYAHALRDEAGRPMGVVHRDISHGNILVPYDGVVKLLDFGVAKARDRIARTKTGVTKGKLRYMSPEQALAKEVDHRSDLFSLAVVLWELTVGVVLFNQAAELERLRAIVDADARRPSEVVNPYPAELEAILIKGLARDRERRFQSAGAFKAALERFAHNAQLDLSARSLGAKMRALFAPELEVAHAELEGYLSDADKDADAEVSDGYVDLEVSLDQLWDDSDLIGSGFEPTGIHHPDTEVDSSPRFPPPELDPADALRLALAPEQLAGDGLSPNELYVLVKISSGARLVGEVIDACAIKESDVMDILRRHVQAGYVLTEPGGGS